MADSPVIEMMEQELTKKKDEVMALEQALAVLRGNTTARELMYLPKSREFEHLGTTEAVKRLLREFGPKSTRELAELALDRGIKTRSKNYTATVYATLEQNASAFKRNEAGQWELVGAKN